jgi:hypothetical protein
MESAAHERFWDGLALACGEQRETGAVYLWGYVAEMLLKCACLRARRIPGNTDINAILKSEGIKHHRLSDLMDDLRTVRAAAFRPLRPELQRDLRNHVLALVANWDVFLRYRSARAVASELGVVYTAVEWFMSNYPALA